uniref:Uncharacterized protein n=1 Tax=Zea mays TaxID=4577 RepID=A0A804R4E0_MAIZE
MALGLHLASTTTHLPSLHAFWWSSSSLSLLCQRSSSIPWPQCTGVPISTRTRRAPLQARFSLLPLAHGAQPPLLSLISSAPLLPVPRALLPCSTPWPALPQAQFPWPPRPLLLRAGRVPPSCELGPKPSLVSSAPPPPPRTSGRSSSSPCPLTTDTVELWALLAVCPCIRPAT